MTSGWQKWENDWYYIDSETMRAVKYMQVIDGKTYYFNSDCIRYSGLLTWNADGTKSYFDSNGVMASGWQTWKGDKYYISPSTMRAVKYKQVISGKTYYFESSCAMHTGWLQWNADKKWSYFGSNGVMYTGTHTIDGVKYNFGSSGKVNTRYSTDQSKMLDKIKNYSSKTKYLIAVNRSTHKVGVFVGSKGNWTYKYYWSCVTGASGSPTITGSYYTTGFKRTKLTTDSRAKWATQINGGYFFHSILASESELGKSLSHGCIRLATSNAKWIYNNIYAGTRVVIYG